MQRVNGVHHKRNVGKGKVDQAGRGILVVVEVNPSTSIDTHYLTSIYPAKYEDLSASCYKLVRDDALRNELEDKALSTFRQFPQSRFLTKILYPI